MVMYMMKECGADVHKESDASRPTHEAAHRDMYHALQYMVVERNADVWAADAMGHMAGCRAVEGCTNTKIVDFLLKKMKIKEPSTCEQESLLFHVVKNTYDGETIMHHLLTKWKADPWARG